MTKKHFEALAAITSAITNDETRKMVAMMQAGYFETINPNFDPKRYLDACDVN